MKERRIKAQTDDQKVVWEKCVEEKFEIPFFSDSSFPKVRQFPPGYGWVVLRAHEITAEIIPEGPWGVIQIDASTVFIFGAVGPEIPAALIFRTSPEESFEIFNVKISFNLNCKTVTIKQKS